MADDKHHVAWADRLGFNKLWAEDIGMCSRAKMSDNPQDFISMVERLDDDIINISNGAKLRDTIDKQKKILDSEMEQQLERYKIKNEFECRDPAFLDNYINNIVKYQYARKLYRFILQLLENKGFGFYKGESSGEYDTWD